MRYRVGRLLLFVVVLLAFGGCASSNTVNVHTESTDIRRAARPTSLRASWSERTNRAPGYPAMTFHVTRITSDGATWSVDASVLNDSERIVKVIIDPDVFVFPARRFGLVTPNPDCKPIASIPQSCDPPSLTIEATEYDPPLPQSLNPHDTWQGTFSGSGQIPRQRLINVVFGAFAIVGSDRSFSWTSQRAFKLP
jgi:hypothetical protein